MPTDLRHHQIAHNHMDDPRALLRKQQRLHGRARLQDPVAMPQQRGERKFPFDFI
jgi:hypothetical protein